MLILTCENGSDLPYLLTMQHVDDSNFAIFDEGRIALLDVYTKYTLRVSKQMGMLSTKRMYLQVPDYIIV